MTPADTLRGRARLIDGLAAVSAVGAGINATYANVLSGEAALAAMDAAEGIATSSPSRMMNRVGGWRWLRPCIHRFCIMYPKLLINCFLP